MANKPYTLEMLMSRGILQSIQAHAEPPYIAELCRELSISTGKSEHTVYKMVMWLTNNGFLVISKRGMEMYLSLNEAGHRAIKEYKNV